MIPVTPKIYALLVCQLPDVYRKEHDSYMRTGETLWNEIPDT